MQSKDLSKQSSNIVIKVQDGTRSDGEHLCKTCMYAHVVEFNNNNVVSICGWNGSKNIRRPVVACNRYLRRGAPTLNDMEEIAWRLVTKSAGREIGFVNAASFRKMEQEEGNRPSPPGFH